jgi:hypothetical protein
LKGNPTALVLTLALQYLNAPKHLSESKGYNEAAISLNKKSEMSPIQSPRGKISKVNTVNSNSNLFSSFLKGYFNRISKICESTAQNKPEDDFDLRQEIFDVISLVLFRNGAKLSIKSGLYSTKVNKINIATVKE